MRNVEMKLAARIERIPASSPSLFFPRSLKRPDSRVRKMLSRRRNLSLGIGDSGDMCLAIPGIVESVEGRRAVVDFGGVKREAMLDLMEEGSIKPGTYVIVHTGFVIQTLDREEAEKTIETWRELLAKMDER